MLDLRKAAQAWLWEQHGDGKWQQYEDSLLALLERVRDAQRVETDSLAVDVDVNDAKGRWR